MSSQPNICDKCKKEIGHDNPWKVEAEQSFPSGDHRATEWWDFHDSCFRKMMKRIGIKLFHEAASNAK